MAFTAYLEANNKVYFTGITDPKATWCYKDDKCGEATWPTPCASGKAQSPIDLPKIEKTSCTIKSFPRETYESQYFSLESNKKTVGVKLLDFEPSFEWQEQQATYTFHSIQFHWGGNDSIGSEHTISGKQFALEMQLIHYRDNLNSLEEAIGSNLKNSLAIISVLFEVDAKVEKNEDLQPIIKFLPAFTIPMLARKVNPGALMKGSEAYTYQGSLTIPSCGEQVQWLIWKQPIKISRSDVEVFRKVTSTNKGGPLLDNFRSIQKLEDRKVQLCEIKFDKDKRRQISE
ncbi:Carbonic anhydrase 6 [Orchesella cincta]|uniref:carbonic anhydrase n=1 Tax=Orchesella cincta TaxID=48709 RepID=A0A1D2MWH1_ORCCI|nr:Carbonic anhydrase 6 [Orchesella cincta]